MGAARLRSPVFRSPAPAGLRRFRARTSRARRAKAVVRRLSRRASGPARQTDGTRLPLPPASRSRWRAPLECRFAREAAVRRGGRRRGRGHTVGQPGRATPAAPSRPCQYGPGGETANRTAGAAPCSVGRWRRRSCRCLHHQRRGARPGNAHGPGCQTDTGQRWMTVARTQPCFLIPMKREASLHGLTRPRTPPRKSPRRCTDRLALSHAPPSGAARASLPLRARQPQETSSGGALFVHRSVVRVARGPSRRRRGRTSGNHVCSTTSRASLRFRPIRGQAMPPWFAEAPHGRLPRPDASRHPPRAALTLSADALQST